MLLEGSGPWAHDYGAFVVVAAGFVFNAIAVYGGLRYNTGQRQAELAALNEWRVQHIREDAQRDKQLLTLSNIAASTSAIATGQEIRLKMLEDEARDHRRLRFEREERREERNKNPRG